MVVETNSEQETFLTGKKMGEQASPGQILCIDGDLGVGKTVFTKGFAAGLGILEEVNSPTFTILQIYDEGGFRSIILMSIESEIRRKCMKSDLRIICLERASH